MILEGAGVCPLVKVGNIVEGKTVTDIRCDRDNAGACNAFSTLALIIFREGLEVGDAMNPGNAALVDCGNCPVLAKDPDHKSKTKHPYELIKAAMLTTSDHEEPKDREPVPSEHEHYDRFELIDISEEEQSDEESSSNPNQ